VPRYPDGQYAALISKSKRVLVLRQASHWFGLGDVYHVQSDDGRCLTVYYCRNRGLKGRPGPTCGDLPEGKGQKLPIDICREAQAGPWPARRSALLPLGLPLLKAANGFTTTIWLQEILMLWRQAFGVPGLTADRMKAWTMTL
jgi:hypothetical protein